MTAARRRRSKPLTPTERQRRWRAKKAKADRAAGLLPPRRKPKSAAQRQAKHRANAKRKVKAVAYLAKWEQRRLARGEGDGSIDLRVGDCRKVLSDILNNSVALILTDPPYADDADPLFKWLADFAMRVLMPGGSLICFTGHHRIPGDLDLFRAAGLRWWWIMSMRHDQSRPLPGKFVNPRHKPVLWFVKGDRRSLDPSLDPDLIDDVLIPKFPNKAIHLWGQGDGGIKPIVEALTRKGDLVVDPFCGTGEWGEICASLGCKWIGADVVEGGSMRIVL
jgi:hypothetical protein